MKKYEIILFLLILPFFSISFLKKPKSKALPAYEVKFTFIGYASFQGGLENCHMNDTGKVILTGILQGKENVGQYDNVLYFGKLQLSIHLDICSAKREADGQDKFCTMNVNGSGPVKTELEIDTAAGYGYIKIEYDSSMGQFQRSVTGTCDGTQMIEEQNMVPNETIATIFNGLELTALSKFRTLGQLQLRKEYSDQMENGKVIVQVLRKIS